ncbi:MAG: pyridoxal phosphate enzyme (YggS family) [Bacteriovoracaceae bacterium]|jgi:pyridoxal phosphate enzyme (YggS family)
MSLISKNLDRISNQLKKSSNLLAVSKTRPEGDIRIAYEWGQRHFGENKVQDLFEKSNSLIELDIKWHFIGHLQSNKINQLLGTPNLVAIHSIDSLKLLNKLLGKKVDSKIGIFLQVNTSGEVEKGGLTDLAQLDEAVENIQKNDTFFLQGLMTIGKIRTDDFEASAKESFTMLKELKDTLDRTHGLSLELSMGMSQDFEIAQEYGSDWIRIGTDIFGKRV